ncbi:MAG: hypothetical protein R3E08_06305 [Thiotrichaceae bacterium]
MQAVVRERGFCELLQAFQGVDAVALRSVMMGYGVATKFGDNDAVFSWRKRASTLLILDNVESLESAVLCELSDVAAQWSEIGDAVVVTTRTDINLHAAFPRQRQLQHRALTFVRLAGGRCVGSIYSDC